MFDYTNNFPIIQAQPEASQLRYKAFTETPEFLGIMQGKGKVVDVNKMFDPSSWGTKDDAIDSVTSDEYLNGMKILSAYQGDMRGYMEDAAAFVGLDWFKDESKAAVVRGVFLGKEPLSPIKYRDSELTPESLKTINDNLQILLEQEKGVTADPNNLTPNQKRIKEYVDKLVYNKAKEKAKFNLGFSPNSFIGDVINTTSDRFDFITNKSNAEAADLSDVIRIETEVDPSFNPSEWFDSMTKDPVVKAGLLQYGISDSLIAGAPNEDAAKLIIGRHLSKTDIQKRVSQYSPTWTDEVNLFATTMLNDPDLVPGIVLEAGVTALGAAAGTLIGGPVGTVAGGTAAKGLLSTVGLGRSFVALKRVYDSSRLVRAGVYATETVAKLPLGMAPNYAKKLGLLGAVGSAGALGVVGGTLTETFRQRSELAYAAATLYSDPDAQKEYDYEAVAWAGLSSGLFGGALFGLAPSLIGAGFGATLNRLKGINLAKYGEPVLRDEFNKQWSLKGTLVGESLDSIKGVFKKEKTVIDGPVDEKLIAKAELTGEKPTGTEVVAETKERVDRAETRDIDSVEKATIVPEENAAKRYDNESKEQYINRVAPNRLITDIVSFARELSRSVPDALDNLKLSSFDWTKMTDKDKITVLNDAKTWINKAKEIESKAVGGLSLDRAKVYEVMEKQRRTYIRNLGKNMTKDEFKAFMKEVRGERRLALPAALEEARRTSATNKEKQEAASEVAAQLIERAKEISKDRDKSVRVREEVPAEVLKAFDSATTEASLTGKVSEETAEVIRNNVMGIERPARKFNMVRHAIDNALLKKRLDPRRMEKIRAVVENPRNFVDIVEGNKEAALRFYRFVSQLKMKKLIAPEHQELLLAAVVHLNFDNRALNIEYKLDILEKNVVGRHSRENNAIIINTAWQGDQASRARTVLHELGHAFVSHKAKGELYLDMLKLYSIPISKDGATIGNKVHMDSMLQMDFLREYHLSNVEETFVQTFAQILFKEGQIAVNTLSPIETSLLKKSLDVIAESLVLAADIFNQSKYYKAANEVIDELVKVNKLLDDGVSVGRFVHKFTNAVTNASSVEQANAILKTGLKTDKYVISADEWDLVSRMTETDPAFIVAYAIVKTQGKSLKSQADYDFLVNAYAAYKTAQFDSLIFRISLAMNVEKDFIKSTSKEQRIAFIENYYFDVVDTKEMGTVVNTTSAELPTYEDRVLMDLPSIETKDNYGRSYWLTTGTALRAELESRGINTDKFDTNAILSNSVFEFTKRYLNALGLDAIADTFASVLTRRQIRRMTDGILNVEPSVDITNTPSFKKWFGKSKVVDKDGKPLVMYHGTDAEEDFSVFKKRAGMIFFSSDPEFASIYARVSGRVYPVYIKAENIFEAGNKNQIEQIRKTAKSLGLENDIEAWLGMTLERFEEITKDADWIELEEWDIRRAIKLAGFDAMYVEEQGVKNIAVFDESQIKSIYNRGTFDPTNPDIRFNIELPDWTNKDIATSAISEMLKNDLNLASVFQILPAQIEPNLLKTLIDVANKEGNTPEQSVTELLTGIYNAIDRGVVSYNTKTKKWETAQPKIKKKSTRKPKEAEVVKLKEPVKTAEETEVEAIADNSDPVTIDNYMEHLHGLMEKLSRDVESKGKNKGFISKSSEEAIVYIGKIMMGETPKLLASIESGSINTVAKLEAAIRKRGKNVVAEEGKEYRRITVTDPVTGQKTTKKVSVESVVSEAGKTKEGAVAGRMERIEEDGLERENKISLIENINKILQHIPDFITSSERELLDVFRLKPINVDAAKELNVSESTISRRYNTLLKKLNSLFTEAGIDAEVLKDPLLLKDQLDLWSKRNKDTVAAVSKKKPTKAKVKKAEADKPAKVDVDESEKGKRIAEMAAKAAKLKNEDPTPVPTPVTTTEPTMARVTAEVTGNAPEEVLRPEKQADAIIDGDTAAVKEVVAFTPKKPMSVAFNSIEELNGNPEKKAKLLALAPRMGFDAIVFKDGSVLPLKAEEAKVVGKTEINKPVGVETVVTVTKEKGVPVKKVTPAPKKPKAAPEGTPVVVKKTGEPKKTKPVQVTKSDVVKTEEAIRIERIANEQKETARANGLDSSFLKRLLNVYWKAMKEIDKGTDVPYTPMFMKAWSKFIVINKELMDVNLKLVGEEGIAKFWAKVDELRAIEQVKKVTVPGYSARTDKAIFAEAAKSVDEKFIPFVTPGSLKIKVVNGDVVFTSKDPLVKAIVGENKTESPVPVPPTPKPNEKVEVVQLPEADDADVSEIESKLEEGIINAEGNASLPLRQSNLIGVIFGGDNREAINWWRALMNWMVNTTQTDSATGLTIRSMQHSIRFVSRMFDDTKAQTGHLAAAGKHAFRTAAQAKADEKRTIARLAKYQMRINKYLENMPDQRKALMLTIYRKLTEGAVLTDADVRAVGITDASMATTILKNSNELLGVVRQTNKTLLDLEAETGLVNTVDAMGNPVDPDKWATVQLDHEQLSRLSPEQRKALVGKLVAARTSRKLASSTLDINTLIVLGWLDVAPTAEARGTRLFAGDREYRPGIGVNTISKGSLDKLRTGITYPVGTDPGNILANLANKGMPDEFFVLKENGVLNVYRMPKVIDDLAEADVIRYREAVSGNTALYHPRWQTYLNRRNLIEAEMEEMLDFKTKSGAYSEFNSKTSSNIDRPLMRTGADEQVALAVPGLTPEEVLSFPEITGVMRTNIAEAYFYFLNGRMFELLFQRELDRLLGTKGITIINVFDWLVKYNERALKDLAKTQNWTDDVLNARIEEVRTGVSRLREEYAINADTLPYIPNKRLYSARAGLALMKMKVAPGYILSTMTEVMQELLKSNLIELPANLVNSIRYVFADIRSKKSKLLEEDIGDLPFILDNFKAEYGDRLLGEVSHGAFELDSKMKTKFIDSSKPLGALDRGVRSLETGARVAESIGSLQAVTNFVRSLAMTRWQRRIWTHISKQRIQKLLDVMENPDMRTLMDQMLEASLTNPVEERKLWKKFAAEARKAGFGFEPQEAMIFFRYGLNTKEKIKHLEYLIKNSGADSRGRVNINRMVNTYWQNKRNPQAGIDPRILEEVLSSYTYMLDDLIIRTSSPEPTGLGRITNVDSKTSFGRLWYALTSWIRGYQDSVVLNYASQSTLSFLGKSIILFGVLDTLTGLFREWTAGREHEDIVDEFTNSPSSFAVRVMKAAPIMGSANAFLEMFLSGLSALSGGSWRYYGSPMSSIGINAAGSATKDITTGVFDLAGQFTADDTEGAKVTKAIGDITSLNSLFNRSPVAVPARFIEDMGALDQKGAVQKYMDLIQREPYPYAKTQKKAKAGQATGTTVMPMERNIAQERAMFEEARKRQIKPEPVSVSTSNKGVSSILGNLLENE